MSLSRIIYRSHSFTRLEIYHHIYFIIICVLVTIMVRGHLMMSIIRFMRLISVNFWTYPFTLTSIFSFELVKGTVLLILSVPLNQSGKIYFLSMEMLQ